MTEGDAQGTVWLTGPLQNDVTGDTTEEWQHCKNLWMKCVCVDSRLTNSLNLG